MDEDATIKSSDIVEFAQPAPAKYGFLYSPFLTRWDLWQCFTS